MPKYHCDYCGTSLTHDSMSVRKSHSIGKNHIKLVIDYYETIAVEEGLLPESLLTMQSQPNGTRLMTPQLQSILYPTDQLDQHAPLDYFTTGAPGTTSRENVLQNFSIPKSLPYPAATPAPFSAHPQPESQATGLIPTPVSEMAGSIPGNVLQAPMAAAPYTSQIPSAVPGQNELDHRHDTTASSQASEFLTSLATGPAAYGNSQPSKKVPFEKPADDYTRNTNRVKFSDQYGENNGSNNYKYSGMKNGHSNSRNHGHSGGFNNGGNFNNGSYNNNNNNNNNNNGGNYNNGGNFGSGGSYNKGGYNNGGNNHRGGNHERGFGNRDTNGQDEAGFDRRSNGYNNRRDNNQGGWDRNSRDRDGGYSNSRDNRFHRDRNGPYSRPNRSGYERDGQYGGRQSRGFRDREG